jgi:hypothetical protein
MTLWICSLLVTEIKNMMMAEKKELTMTPDNSMVWVGTRPSTRAMK